MHMANAPGAPTAAPFSPGAPDPGVGAMTLAYSNLCSIMQYETQ